MPINGILLLNKSEGMTSNKALQKVKHLLGAAKAGHTGSLDPLATGMLPLCFGEATKVCQFLLDADKCYQTTGLLGIKTTTADAAGEITERVTNISISKSQLEEALAQHSGQIKQIPSMYSALKHNGTPLYRLARQGIAIERKARDITINQLKLESFDAVEFSLMVQCSKGTYIRNLVEDIGDYLGVGAHVVRLHRVYTAGLENKPMFTLEQLEAMSLEERFNCLLPMDEAVSYLPALSLLEEEVVSIRQGRLLKTTKISTPPGCIRLYTTQAQFIGLGETNATGDIKAKRLISF